MATNFNPATKISVSGPLSISDKRSADMPLDIRGRIETLNDITTIPFAWEGMLVYVRDTKKYYKVTSLANRTVGGVAIPYYPATWVEFGSGGSTPSPTPSEIDAGDVSYFSSGTFSNNTVGKELQSLASDILGLAEDIHNLSGDIGTLSNLNTENKQDLVAAINEVLASTGSTITVVDNLLSNSTTDALSAYQGKVLKGLIDGKVAGIKVQGESSVLPMDGNGIVTIPAGGGEGTITGATLGGSTVPEVGGVLNFPAYPAVPITGIKDSNGNDINPLNGKVTLPAPPSVPITKIRVEGASTDLPTEEGRVVIPSTPVKGIKTSSGSDLTPNNGIVTLPAIPADQSSRIKNIEDTLQQIANAEPIVIPASAVELPTLANSTITYDSDDTYVMNISGTQIATVHYPYEHSTNSYLAFKAIDRDLYYVYQLTNAANNTYTFVEQHTYDELSHEEAKAVFEAGKYAVKQVIDVRHTGNPIPEGYFKHGIPSAFVTPDGYPLRYNQIKENNVWYILLKCDENNKIFKYSASNGKWSLVSGGCYTKDNATTGEDYKKYDAYFDRQPASNISFDDTITQLGTQESPVTDVQAAINQLAAGVSGLTGKLKIRLLYQNNTPITDKAVNITVLYRGSSYDISSQYSPNTQGFITDNDGYVINANSNEYILLPLGAQYTIHLYDISNDYITPEDKTGIVDANITAFNFVYENVSNAEMVYFYVQLTNATPNVANVNNKKIYVDFYSDATTHALQYQCVLRDDGTVKQILDANGNQATYNGENLISTVDPVLMPVPIGTKYTCALQEWDESISSDNQRYIKSSNVTVSAANKAKRTIRFTYKDNQVGIFLVIADSTKSRGYRECLITDVDTVNNEITFVDDNINYKAYLNNSTLYKEIIGTETPELWEETILGYGMRTSTTIYAVNNDTVTQNEYPDCSFFIPKTRILYKQQLLTISQAVSLPQDFGGLFCTRNLYNLTDGQSSPAAHALIDDNLYALTLNTPNSGTNVIKAFIASKSQITVTQGNKPIIDNISIILTGTAYHTGGSVGVWQSNLSTTATTGYDFDLRKSNDYLPFNPTANSGASTAYYSFIMYPF